MLLLSIVSSLLLITTSVLAQQPVQTSIEPQQPSDSTVAPATDSDKKAAASTEAAPDSVLGAGDLVAVEVFGVPEMKQEMRISNRGEIGFPLLGAVKIGGLTADQASQKIHDDLVSGGFLTNPQVSVFVKEYNSLTISVLGEVNKPGAYPPIGQRRLMDVISQAGGLTSRAGSTARITRRGSNEMTVANLGSDPFSNTAPDNPEIQPGDTVLITKAGIVYVVGDVGQPGGYVMENNGSMTVLQAIALARGVNHTAKSGDAKLIRKTATGPQEIPIPLNKILSSQSKDLTLLADDIIFVPNSAAKSAARRGAESILQVATGLAIYRR